MNAFYAYAKDLPVAAVAADVNRALAARRTVVVTAPPGAGKSTLLPLTILEGVEGKVLMLEPRRVAARQIAERMAYMLGEPVGRTVGYRMRFEQKVSALTRVEVLTEGVLVRRLMDDPGLDGVSVVIFDEFHERSLTTDVALSLTREAQQVLRPDLRILLMSATIDTDALCRELDAPLIESRGKMFPVEIVRGADATPENAAETVAKAVREAHRTYEGDILAFLPGEADIRCCAQLLGTSLGSTAVCPLYGMLSLAEQRRAIAPSRAGERKVVLATPIAETSLTIEGVRVVVDSGFCRKLVYDQQRGLSRLETVRISRDMADQRTGRAGRVAPGVCYRLWSAVTEQRMQAVRIPEILEADLAPTVLDIAAWGESRPGKLPWLTPPPALSLVRAQELLQELGALDASGGITAHGRALAALPCHPRVAQMLLKADTPDRKALAADLAALLEEKDPLNVAEAGAYLRIKALRDARRSRREGRWSRLARIAAQYRQMVRVPEDNGDPDPFEAGALLAAAYPGRIAKAWKEGAGRFRLAGGDLAAVDPSDPLAGSEWLAVGSLHAAPGGVGRIFLAAPLGASDLKPFIRRRDIVAWDSRQGSVLAQRESRVGQLSVGTQPLSDVPREEIVRVICEAARKEGTSMLDFSDEVQNLQRRVAAVAAWHPELELPDLSTETLLQRAPEWLPPFIGKASSAAELKRIDLCEALWSLLDWPERQAVERLAPSHVTVPTGSRIRVEYRTGADAPVVRVRLQECFGLQDTPRVDDGRRPVLMELLSPGYKPVQLTSDLRSFWEGTYFEVRKELKRRYPKHAWPDDPLDADPVRGVRKKQ
ncbi:MAG: ATP-dependent helicase HrpB [Bacteroidales bacterium]|nr:ATP-dependent helicase HrpB [Bacteroidales bacterium]